MEGERILNVLKKRCEDYESVCEDAKNYLSPVLSKKKKKHENALEFEKLELFSLKLFKLCIEQLQKKDNKDKDTLGDVAVLCIDSLLICSGSSSKAPPLSFEKMLLHFAKWCLSTTTKSSERYELGLKSCRELTTRLRDSADRKNVSPEMVNLLKIVYDILWKSSLAMEQNNEEIGVAKLCLEMRTVALESLVTSGKFEICAVLRSAMKTDLRYRRTMVCVVSSTSCGCGHNNKGSISSKTNVKCSCQKGSQKAASTSLNTSINFHSSLEKTCNISSLIHASLDCREFTVGVGYLLQSNLLLLKSPGHCNEGVERLKCTLDLCANHGELCDLESHLIVTAQANCLQLWQAVREEEENDFLDHSHLYLNILAESMGDVISSACHHDNQEAVHWLAESLELVFGCLRKRRETCHLTEKERGPTGGEINFIPKSAFQSFKTFILNSVDFLDIILQVHSRSTVPAQQEYSIRQNQLVLLSLMADALVDLLSEDEIEILRSSAPDPLSSLMAPPHPKKELADCCMPIIKNSQQIINKAGQNVLSVTEHKWVGNDAHRLGQALCSCDLLREACQVLEVSCDELTVWCSKAAPSSGEEQKVLSRETRLLERFINLCSVYVQNGDYLDALSTIEKAITSLPANQITERDTMSMLVGQWVRVKRHIANESSQQFSGDIIKSAGRSLGAALKRVGGVSDEVIILYLETELDMCQGQSHDTHSSEVMLIKELLFLHSLTDSHSSRLHTARLTTRLSTLCRTCHASSGCNHTPCDPPTSLLDDTVALLESLVTTLTPSHSHSLTQAHQHLATAYLWKAISTLEQNVSSVGTADVSKTTEEKDKEMRIELCLSEEERSLMMSDDIIQCLFSAVENWEAMKDKASPLNLPLSEVFHDAVSMFHSLHLTSTLCLTHSQPVLALRCLIVLLNVGVSDTSPLGHQLLPSYNSAVSLCNELLLSTLGPRPHSFPKPHPLPKSHDLGKREMVELHCTKMMADLASARVQIAQGVCQDSQALLLSMLSDPVLEQASTLTFVIVAKAKLLASEILQQRTFDLKSSDAFLHYINNSDQSSERDDTFRLTPLELAVDAVKIFQKLANHRNVKITPENGSRQADPSPTEEAELDKGFLEPMADQTPTVDHDSAQTVDNEPDNEGAVESSLLVSSSVGAWDILIGLMTSLRGVAKLYLDQGIVKEAHHYAREGAVLARGLLLPGWFTEFSLLLSKIESVKGEYELATQYCLQTSKLLESESHCQQLLLMPSTNGQREEGKEITGESKNDVEMADYDSFSDEDSFLDHVANLDIHTPPSSPRGSAVFIKGTPPLHGLEVHPKACLCQVCTNPLSLLHTAKLVVQCVDVALWQTRDKMEKASASTDEVTNVTDLERRVSLLASALVNLKDVVNQRMTKCDKMLEGVSLLEYSEGQGHVTGTSGRDGRRKGSSRSTKSAPQRKTNKSSKTASKDSSEIHHYSVTKAIEFKCVLADLATAEAECCILLEKPSKAMEVAKSALSQLQGDDHTDKELCLALARLHYQMGVACVQEVELNQPVVAKQLWEECSRKEEVKCEEKEEAQCSTDGGTKSTTRSKSKSSNRRTTTRRTKTTASKKSAKSVPNLDSVKSPFSQSLEHFLMCYQLCFPNLPSVLMREVCQWVGLLVRAAGATQELSAHFINSGINCTLTHQAVYSLGKKIRKYGSLGSSPAVSKSTRHHIEEIQLTFDTATPTNHTSRGKYSSANNSPLLSGRGVLRQGSTHPPTLSYTRSLQCLLPSDCGISTLCLGPKTHPSRQNHLVIAQRTCSSDGAAARGGVTVGVVKLDQALMLEFDSILCSSTESVSLKERREWWGARGKLDKQLKTLLQNIETDCLGKCSSLLCPDATSGQSEIRTVILVLGRHIQHLPWESLPVLKDQIVCRMPSIPFTAAHSLMLNSGESRDKVVSFNPHSAYFILNPHADLKNTEKRFANFFSNERGWSGVIGSPPTHEEFATALQEKDLYVYCGHSVGRFLASSGFQLLDCHATALLAGCSSAKLTVSGRCDPTGIPLSYLTAGCPALVGCLWDVTDGEIDRLCHALLKHLLGDDDKATPLPSLVGASRTACKLQWLTGASTIVYGLPVTVGVASEQLS